MKQYSFIKELQGEVQIEEFKEITKKSGEKTFLLKLLVSDESATVYINIWGMKAIETLKRLENGRVAIITNLIVKKKLFNQEKELLFTKKSSLQMS
jgi:hypothetical protein